MTNKHNVDLTQQELDVIEAALHTQEKILSMQSRASGDTTAASRLSELKSTLRKLRKQKRTNVSSWNFMSKTLFG